MSVGGPQRRIGDDPTDPLRRPPVPHDHVRQYGCYRCVWPDGESSPLPPPPHRVEHDASCADYRPAYRCPSCVKDAYLELAEAVEKINGNYLVTDNYGQRYISIPQEVWGTLRDLMHLRPRDPQ